MNHHDDDDHDDDLHAERSMLLTLPCEPSSRIKRDVKGVEVVLGGGQTWLLVDAGLSPSFDAVRDTMFDNSTMTGHIPLEDIRCAAWTLLKGNYHLTGEEAAALVCGAEAEGLGLATIDAVFGRNRDRRIDDNRVTYTSWARSALEANGLIVENLTPSLIHDVLTHLVSMGRAVPAAQMITSMKTAAGRRKAMGNVARSANAAEAKAAEDEAITLAELALAAQCEKVPEESSNHERSG